MDKIDKKQKPIATKDNKFCAQPWSGLQVRPDKTIQPCCMFDRPLAPYTGADKLEKTLNSGQIKRIRDQILNDQLPPECSSCLQEEEVTGTSPRIFSPGLIKTIEEHENDLEFNKVELFISNACNLDCTMCSPTFSTKWNAIVDDFNTDDINYQDYEKEQPSSIKEEDIEPLFHRCKNAKEVVLIGGEPFSSELTRKFLKLWHKYNCKGQLTLTTNLTLTTEEDMDLISKCHNVLLVASIDGHGDTYEWIRGFSWDKVEKNILLAKKYKTNLLLIPTIGLANIFNLGDLSNFCHENDLRLNLSHMLISPDFLSLMTIPQEIRTELIKQYAQLKCEEVDILLESLANPTLEDIDDKAIKLKRWIEYFNQKRKMNLYEIHPELKPIISNL